MSPPTNEALTARLLSSDDLEPGLLHSDSQMEGFADLPPSASAAQLPTSDSAALLSTTFPTSDSNFSVSTEAGNHISFMNDIMSLVKLPNTIFKKEYIAPIAFGGFTAGCGSILYILGANNKPLEYAIGGPAVNFPQSMLYGAATWNFLKDLTDRRLRGRVIGAAIFGTISTTIPVIAAYKFADTEYLKYVAPICTGVGNLANNVYGMFDPINRVWKKIHENQKVRKFLLDKLRNGLTLSEQSLFSDERGSFGEAITYAAGIGLVGSSMAGAQTGYTCMTSVFAIEKTSNTGLGVTLGVMANLPNMLIGLLLVGYDFVGYLVDKANRGIRDKSLHLTEGDKLQILFCALTAGAWAYFARYSSATSDKLFDDYCPDFGIAEELLAFITDVGTMVFNFSLALLASFLVSNTIKVTYDTANRRTYELRELEHQIKYGASTEELEKFALRHFPNERHLWQKPEAVPKVTGAHPTVQNVPAWEKAPPSLTSLSASHTTTFKTPPSPTASDLAAAKQKADNKLVK